jgi:hypothetical protein
VQAIGAAIISRQLRTASSLSVSQVLMNTPQTTKPVSASEDVGNSLASINTATNVVVVRALPIASEILLVLPETVWVELGLVVLDG